MTPISFPPFDVCLHPINAIITLGAHDKSLMDVCIFYGLIIVPNFILEIKGNMLGKDEKRI